MRWFAITGISNKAGESGLRVCHLSHSRFPRKLRRRIFDHTINKERSAERSVTRNDLKESLPCRRKVLFDTGSIASVIWLRKIEKIAKAPPAHKVSVKNQSEFTQPTESSRIRQRCESICTAFQRRAPLFLHLFARMKRVCGLFAVPTKSLLSRNSLFVLVRHKSPILFMRFAMHLALRRSLREQGRQG